jgi:hypothetical protein
LDCGGSPPHWKAHKLFGGELILLRKELILTRCA